MSIEGSVGHIQGNSAVGGGPGENRDLDGEFRNRSYKWFISSEIRNSAICLPILTAIPARNIALFSTFRSH